MAAFERADYVMFLFTTIASGIAAVIDAMLGYGIVGPAIVTCMGIVCAVAYIDLRTEIAVPYLGTCGR